MRQKTPAAPFAGTVYVSPYLLRPIRTVDQVLADRKARDAERRAGERDPGTREERKTADAPATRSR